MKPRMNYGRLETARGPHGEVIATKTYSNFRYSVTIGVDGAIRVKHGDWLTKYSAAMYNNFSMIHEFQRRDASGKFVPIWNPNLIISGETLYHMPTANAYLSRSQGTDPHGTPPELPDGVVKAAILEHLKGEFGLRGERLEILNRVAAGTHKASEFGEAAEPLVHLLEEGGVATGAEAILTILSLLGPIAFVVEQTLEFLDQNEKGQRIIGLRAIAYGMTAWAFDDQPLRPPSWISTNAGFMSQEAVSEERAWSVSCQAAWKKLESAPAQQIIHAKRKSTAVVIRKEWIKALFRAFGDNDRNKLVDNLMEELAKKYLRSRTSDVDSFWSPKPSYPN